MRSISPCFCWATFFGSIRVTINNLQNFSDFILVKWKLAGDIWQLAGLLGSEWPLGRLRGKLWVWTWCLRRYSLFLKYREQILQRTLSPGKWTLVTCWRRFPAFEKTLKHSRQTWGCMHFQSGYLGRESATTRKSFSIQFQWHYSQIVLNN